MAMAKNDIKTMLDQAFPDALITLEDLVGDSNHYRLKITSNRFKGLSRVAQHQLVYQALGEKMGSDLHALSVSTAVPPNND